jgi:hypothetical protein
MIARSIGVVGFGFVDDALVLSELRSPPAEYAVPARELAWWDLLLWSPFFLVWGACWTAVGWRLRRTDRERL